MDRHPGIPCEAIKTTGDSKPVMIERSIYAHEQGLIRYSVGPISDEHKSFVRNGSRMEAMEGAHDDTVMALAFALMVAPFASRRKKFDIPLSDYAYAN